MTDTKYLYQYFLEKSIQDDNKEKKYKKTYAKGQKPLKVKKNRLAEDAAYE